MQKRIHHATSGDGTRIVGRVYGHGPPVVLVHGAIADGESEWGELVPLLADRFTCYVPSTRGRGQSDDHPDHSIRTRVQDVVNFVESVGPSVGLIGVSGGGMLALGAAAATSTVAALVACEPVAYEVLDETTRAHHRRVAEGMDQAQAEDRAIDGARMFLEWGANDEERSAFLSDPQVLEDAAAYLSIDVIEFFESLGGSRGFSSTDPSILERITVPTLLLHGSQTGLAWFTASTLYVARHVAHATVRRIPGNGHLGHILHPERVAEHVVPFLDATLAARGASPAHR